MILAFVLPVSAAAPITVETALQVIIAGSSQTVTLSQLQKQLPSENLTVYSPVYGRLMTYQGFWLDQLLQTLKIDLGERDVVFQSADGYGTSLSAGEIGKEKWLLAYGEPHGWTPLPQHKPPALPGPWYLVGRDTNSYKETPWPYQVVAIKIRGDW